MGRIDGRYMAHLLKFGLIAVVGTGLALAQDSAKPPGIYTKKTTQSEATPPPTAAGKKADGPAPSEITVHSGKMESIGHKDELAYDAQHPMPTLAKTPITKETRMLVMRSLNAETVFERKALPMGQRGVVLKDGKLSPPTNELAMLVATYGPAVKPGDRAQITDVKILDKAMIFELNGGPKKKKKWYQHIEVGGMGGSVPVSQQSDAEANAKGTKVE